LALLGSLPFLQRLPAASFQQIVHVHRLRHFGISSPALGNVSQKDFSDFLPFCGLVA
jgi:hypothetical protein